MLNISSQKNYGSGCRRSKRYEDGNVKPRAMC
jgi:hypothetical protein